MRPMASASDPGVMPTSTASPSTWPAWVIIDDHEISRAAFVALLRAEAPTPQPAPRIATR